MKKFIIKVVVFIVFPISYFGINGFINSYIFTNQSLPIEKKSILIAGDSHPQKGLDPKYFVRAQNISQTAEPYVLTYWKLEKVFKSYIPDTLILGYAPHNISQFNDLKFSDEKWSGEMFKRSYPLLEFGNIYNDVTVNYQSLFKVLLTEVSFYPKMNHINYIGSYKNSNTKYVSNWEHKIKLHYYNQDKILSYSESAIYYLESIIKLCERNNVELVLVSSPVHENYFSRIPASIMNKYNHLVKDYSKSHIVFDKTRNNYTELLFLDSDHLNQNGAEMFTKELIEYLRNETRTTNSANKQ